MYIVIQETMYRSYVTEVAWLWRNLKSKKDLGYIVSFEKRNDGRRGIL